MAPVSSPAPTQLVSTTPPAAPNGLGGVAGVPAEKMGALVDITFSKAQLKLLVRPEVGREKEG